MGLIVLKETRTS